MKLIANWRDVLTKAWSVRLMILAGLLTGVEVILPLFIESMPRNVFAGLSLVVVSAALVSRIMAQQGLEE